MGTHAEENREQNDDLEKEQQEESKREQTTASSDSFVNDEAKGRQEPTRQEEDSKQEEAADSLVNDVAEAEGRQEPTQQEESKEDSKEEKVADSFVNDVAEAESRQEPAGQRETLEDSNKDEHKSEGKPGILTVHVIEASNLRNKDIMGKSDPYVEVLFEDTKVQSQTVNNNLSPQWNFASNFDASGDSTSTIQFNVFDADYGKDQSLGSCSILVEDAMSQERSPSNSVSQRVMIRMKSSMQPPMRKKIE